jgi:hypothetical protein
MYVRFIHALPILFLFVASFAHAQTQNAPRTGSAPNESDSLKPGRLLDSAGGGAQADFDTLIDLITSTIAPTTWDDVGGEGSIQGFPGGVYVDASGVLKQLSSPAMLQLAPHWKQQAEQMRRNWQRDGQDGFTQASPQRKVSLTRLAVRWQHHTNAGLPISDAMSHLAGLQRIDFLWCDAERGEIIVIGPASGWAPDGHGRLMGDLTHRPVLWLDDFLVLLRNAYEAKSQFMCTITPTAEGLRRAQSFTAAASARPIPVGGERRYLEQLGTALGLQKIEVQGLDAETRVARVLVEADHHMKQIGIGLQPGTDQLSSYLDRLVAEKTVPESLDVLRWWFTLDTSGVTVAESQSLDVGPEQRGAKPDQLFGFPEQLVRVLSENELLTARGERVHTGQSNRLNAQFAQDFTREFSELAQRYPVYADLDNLFRLALVAALIEQADLAERVGGSLDAWLDSQQAPVPVARAPEWTPSLVNYRSIDRRTIVAAVSGGVHFHGAEKPRSAALVPPPVRIPPQHDIWWWD